MTVNKLFVDETGLISGDCGFYILVGCVIRGKRREDLKVLAGQIKYKYWGDDSIVLHSQEIGKCMGAFKILRDEGVREEFYTDLFTLLKLAPVILFPVVLDKKRISERNWGRKRKLKTVCRSVFNNFILLTMATRGCIGKITIESSSLNKDHYYLEALIPTTVKGYKRKLFSEIKQIEVIK
jgi:hypothetical protein